LPVSNFPEKVSFIWSVADLLRGPYKPHQYGRVIDLRQRGVPAMASRSEHHCLHADP
jgi:hypothetical protein